MKKYQHNYLQTILNSYSMVFFSQDNFLAAMLLLSTFFYPLSGLAGLASVVFTVAVLTFSGHQQEIIKSGIYSFNSLLLGIGFGTFYQFNAAFCIWLAVACLVNAMLTVIFYAKTSKYGLPVLSLPFIFSFWLILLAANGYATMGLMQRNSYLLNEIFAGSYLKNISLPVYADLFFRSVSAILFQNNLLTGAIISLGIFVHSRIAFSLMVIGFASACLFNYFTGIYPEGISYYHLGGNIMMVALATGSFFLIPSARSYGWAILSVIMSLLFIIALTKLLEPFSLPLFSLPFCVVSLMLLGFFRLRAKTGKLQLATLQHYSPETNLYLHLSHQIRLNNLQFFRLNLPFMGSWKISQGYNGSITHQGDWRKALDFVIEDEEQKTYRLPGTLPEHFYAYNKPVLACADGTVEEVVNDIDDNAIGTVNLVQNWGNTIVIKHLDGLYSQVSHLKKDSVKVQKGDQVKQGSILGLCGNSGRSPEPHLHFQLQTTPYIGSKTLKYPFAYYISNPSTQNKKLICFETPPENVVVKTVPINFSVKQAFAFKPGFVTKVFTADQKTETWEVFTNTLNQNYFCSKETNAVAYFINDGTTFYFTSFYGDKNTLLYYFFLTAYKVIFTSDQFIKADDQFPFSIRKNSINFWLQDLVAPFFRFASFNYQSFCTADDAISTIGFQKIFSRKKDFFNGKINISDQKISSFNISIKGKNTEVKWLIENIY